MLIYFSLILGIVILDQLSKLYILIDLPGDAARPILYHVFSFRYHENRGMAWGMLANHRWIFMTISTIAILAMICYMIYTRKQKQSPLFLISLSMFIGGGIGNMIDRIRLGYVIDFIRLDFIDFPIFNVADSFVTIGAVLMILHLILETIRDVRSKRTPKGALKNKDV